MQSETWKQQIDLHVVTKDGCWLSPVQAIKIEMTWQLIVEKDN